MPRIRQRSVAWICYGLVVLVFLLDTRIELGVAVATAYLLPVLISYLARDSRHVVITATVASLLTLIGYGISPPGGENWKVAFNRALSLFAIWLTALAGRRWFLANEAIDVAEASVLRTEEKHRADERKHRALANMLEDLNLEREKFIEVTNELSFPPAETDEKTSVTGSLRNLTLTDTIACSRRIRGLTRHHATESDYSAALTDLLYDSFRDEKGESEFALVRLFRTREFSELNETASLAARELRPDNPAATKYLALEGTRGDQEAWNSPATSERHRAIPLTGPNGFQQSTMVTEMLRQAGVTAYPEETPSTEDTRILRGEGHLFISNALDSDYIPDQEDFVKLFGIESVVGYTGEIDHETFLVIGFSKVPVSEPGAELFSHLRHSTCIGLNAYQTSSHAAVEKIRAVGEFIRSKEAIVTHQDQRLRATMERLSETNHNLMAVNEDLEQFAYIASHDLRSPLRGIANVASFIREDDGDKLSESSQRYLEKMEGRIRRMENLLSDLLAYSRIGRTELKQEEIDTRLLLQEIIDLLPVPDHITVSLPETLPVLMTYVTPLRQVFLNLIGNAIKHGGESVTRIDVVCTESQDPLEFSVSDDGIGIAPKYHKEVFEMFRTLQSRDETEGTGMGLAIIRKLVRRFGGDIRLESQLGNGAKFVFTWPNQPMEARKEMTDGIRESDRLSRR